MEPLSKRIEVAELVERNIQLLDLRPQAAKKIVDPSREVSVAAEQDLHAHGRRRQSSPLEEPVKSGSDLRVGPQTVEAIVEEGRGRGPKRQVRSKEKKRSVGNFMEGKYSARTDQHRQATQDGDRIRKELQDETAHSGVERSVSGELVHIAFCKAHVGKAGLGNTSSGPSDGAGVAFDAYHLS
jgi:hypothetical protein